jgi:hypothetical protein
MLFPFNAIHSGMEKHFINMENIDLNSPALPGNSLSLEAFGKLMFEAANQPTVYFDEGTMVCNKAAIVKPFKVWLPLCNKKSPCITQGLYIFQIF